MSSPAKACDKSSKTSSSALGLCWRAGRGTASAGRSRPHPSLVRSLTTSSSGPSHLPSREDWDKAVRRAAAILGVHANKFLTGASVAELAADVRSAVGPHVAAARTLLQLLETVHTRLGVAVDGPGVHRLATARAANALIADVAQRNDVVALVESLARADIPTTDQAVGSSLKGAFNLSAQLQGYSWNRLTPLIEAERQRDELGQAAKEILDRLRAALLADELSQQLGNALRRADDEAFQWALKPRPGDEDDDEDENDDKPTRAGGRARVRGSADLGGVQKQLADFVDQHAGQEIEVEWRVKP